MMHWPVGDGDRARLLVEEFLSFHTILHCVGAAVQSLLLDRALQALVLFSPHPCQSVRVVELLLQLEHLDLLGVDVLVRIRRFGACQAGHVDLGLKLLHQEPLLLDLPVQLLDLFHGWRRAG